MWVLVGLSLFVWGTAWAENVGEGTRARPGGRTGQQIILVGPDSVRSLWGGASGRANINDPDRDRNFYATGLIVNNWLFASGSAMADSSTPIPSYAFRRIALFVYGVPDSLRGIIRLAVQVRGHLSAASDTLSTFPWYRWPPNFNSNNSAGTFGTVFATDSIGHGVATTQVPLTAVQATSANSSNGGLLPGEFKIVFNSSRRDTSANGDGTGSKPFSFPAGMYIPLAGQAGEWFWAPYFSVRVRLLNGLAAGGRFRIRIYYAGTAL
jgi:hypothetical protein